MNVEIEHVQLGFIKELDNNICALRVQSNVLSFALKTGLIFLINLDTPSEVSKFSIPLITASNNSEKLIDMWMNPNGKLLLLKTNFAKYYLCDVDLMRASVNKGSASSNDGIYTVRELLKKSCDIRVVKWRNNESFLCGTTSGQVYLVDTPRKGGKRKTDVSNVYKSSGKIDGILWNEEGHLIIASESKIMYWSNVKLGKDSNFSPPLETEEFEPLHKESSKKFDSHDDSFAWITNTGIVFGSINNRAKVLSNAKVLLAVELTESKYSIRDIIMTDYHIIILRGWTVTIINQLSNAIVFEESILSEAGERMIGLTADYSQETATFWCFSNANIYEIILHNESQAVWKLLCNQKEYDTALNLKGLTDLVKQTLYYEKGCHLLNEKKPIEAAQCLGKSSVATTGSIALKLMDSGDDTESLQIFLATKLDTLLPQHQVQRILLSSWIVWTFMKLLNEVDEEMNTERHADAFKELNDKKEAIINKLKRFLESHLDCIDKETIYQIIAEQNRKQELLFFAKLVRDYEFVLSYWVRQENWYEALRTLLEMQDPESVYKYATVLIVNSPESTTHTWMKIEGVNPVELIPSVLTYFTNLQKQAQPTDGHTPNFALNYLIWCIEEQGADSPIMYNTVLYMMIARNSSGNEAINELDAVRFLDTYEGKYDKDFISRLSVRCHRVEVSIYLYTQFKLYEDAVTLALDNKMIESAKMVAKNRELENNLKLRKVLWLKIAKSMLTQEENQDVKQTIRTIIAESDETIEIRDLLPLFDEFTTIANLKDELIRSLEKHGQSMSQISEQIKHSMHTKKDIVKDIELFKDRFTILEPGASCSSCRKVLQTRKFLVFPCGHCFHTDCLIKVILNSNDYNLKSKIENFQRRLAKNNKSVKTEELESLITTKCCLCSDININTIDEPIEMNEEEAEKWLI